MTMTRFDDPAEMTEGERFREIASILAAGCLRLKARNAALPFSHPGENEPDAEESSPFTENRLDFPGTKRPRTAAGLTPGEPERRR